MSKIKITCDSTADLPDEYLQENGVEKLPLYIILDDQSYRDSVDVFPEDIYKYAQKTGKLPKTAAGSIKDYLDLFKKYTEDYDAVIHISLGGNFSSSHQNARIAAEEFSNVFVVDSENLSTGTGHLVADAVNLVKKGMDAQNIVNELTNTVSKIETSFVIDTLDYLKMGGRCSAIAAFSANLLNIKPCIEVIGGKMEVGKKYRGRIEKAIEKYVKDRLKDRTDIDPERIFITHSGCSDELIEKVKQIVAEYCSFEEMMVTRASCTISSHCGPNTLGILFKRK